MGYNIFRVQMKHNSLHILLSVLIFATSCSGNSNLFGEHGGVITWEDEAVSGQSVVVDANGDIFVSGMAVHSMDLDPGPNGDSEYRRNGAIAFLCKLDERGRYLWGRRWWGNKINSGDEIALSYDGCIYVAGDFMMDVDFDPGPQEEMVNAPDNGNEYLSKFNDQGDFKWVRTWPGEQGSFLGDGYPYFPNEGVVVDNDGNIYLAGSFSMESDFDPGPGEVIYDTGTYETEWVYLSSFTPDGEFRWVRVWEEPYADLTIDKNDNLIVTVGGLVTKLDTSNNIIWEYRIDDEIKKLEIHSIDVDSSGNIFIVGTDNNKVNLIKLTNEPEIEWVKSWSGSDYRHINNIYDVRVNSFGDPYVSGVFNGVVDFGDGIERGKTEPGETITIWSPKDVFLVKYSSDGELQWVRTWGGPSEDQCGGLAADNNGNIYIIGDFYGIADLDPGPGEDLRGVEDNNTMYLIKCPPDGNWY